MRFLCSSTKMLKQQKQSTSAAAKKAAAALRAQLHQELENKKLCAYQSHECTQLTLEGYNYCLRHILEDKTAPYRQCNYIFNTNGKRCHLPAPKADKKEFSYCAEHAFKSHLARVRTGSRHQPPNTTETLLTSLTHYVKPSRDRATNSSSTQDVGEDKSDKNAEEDLKVTRCNNPFTQIDAYSVNASCSDILEYASDSDSDVEPATFSSVWHDAQADSSDAESIDSEQEDVLKHAGIYTAEEVTLVTRDKLIRLQSLYIEQFKHLQHTLRERRRKYLHSLKREKETLSSIHNQVRDTPKEQHLYNKLKALNHYYRKHGVDAIMNKKCTELRAKLTEGINWKQPSYSKCVFTEGGVKCGERALPVARYCRKHILNDPNQVLFKRCGRIQADIDCSEPVFGIFKDSACKYHTEFPPVRNYGESRRDEDSDMETSSDTLLPMNTPAHFTTPTQSYMDFDVKNELSDSLTFDMVGQTSNEASAYSQSSTPHLINFADHIKEEPDADNARDGSDDIDVTTMEDDVTTSMPLADESNSSQNVPTADIEPPNANQTIDEERRAGLIDPDDDMAGIMLELQKDKIN